MATIRDVVLRFTAEVSTNGTVAVPGEITALQDTLTSVQHDLADLQEQSRDTLSTFSEEASEAAGDIEQISDAVKEAQRDVSEIGDGAEDLSTKFQESADRVNAITDGIAQVTSLFSDFLRQAGEGTKFEEAFGTAADVFDRLGQSAQVVGGVQQGLSALGGALSTFAASATAGSTAARLAAVGMRVLAIATGPVGIAITAITVAITALLPFILRWISRQQDIDKQLDISKEQLETYRTTIESIGNIALESLDISAEVRNFEDTQSKLRSLQEDIQRTNTLIQRGRTGTVADIGATDSDREVALEAARRQRKLVLELTRLQATEEKRQTDELRQQLQLAQDRVKAEQDQLRSTRERLGRLDEDQRAELERLAEIRQRGGQFNREDIEAIEGLGLGIGALDDEVRTFFERQGEALEEFAETLAGQDLETGLEEARNALQQAQEQAAEKEQLFAETNRAMFEQLNLASQALDDQAATIRDFAEDSLRRVSRLEREFEELIDEAEAQE